LTTNTNRPAKLGLVLDQVIHQRGGVYSTDEAFFRFVEQVASVHFGRIEFCSRVRPDGADAPYVLDPSLYDVVPLPWYADMMDLCLRSPILFPRIRRRLDAAMRGWDLMIVGAINPLAPLALRLARRRNLPAALWIRGSYYGVLEHRLGKRGLKRAIGMGVSRLILDAIPDGTVIVSSGNDDYPFLARMGPVQVVYSSKFGREDFAPLPRPHRDPAIGPRVLYVGRLAPEKGVDVLFEGFRKLASRIPGPPPTLTLAGADFHGSPYGDALLRRIRESEVGSRVITPGYVPYGPQLFALYDQSDVFALASHTEGFPQSLLEAMARGLPVVSTSVGGVPRVLRDGDNGLLVPPNDAAKLAAALERVVSDPSLAARLSAAGQRSAEPYAREVQVGLVAQFLERSFPKARFH
jgi:glycosyltransferase involved in cell wall biosynthesis